MQRNPLPVVSTTLCDELDVLDFLSSAAFSLLSFTHRRCVCVVAGVEPSSVRLLNPHGLQHTRPPDPSPHLLELAQDSFFIA